MVGRAVPPRHPLEGGDAVTRVAHDVDDLRPREDTHEHVDVAEVSWPLLAPTRARKTLGIGEQDGADRRSKRGRPIGDPTDDRLAVEAEIVKQVAASGDELPESQPVGPLLEVPEPKPLSICRKEEPCSGAIAMRGWL
jgi:hypothetical protein